jgi:hypothetical protein
MTYAFTDCICRSHDHNKHCLIIMLNLGFEPQREQEIFLSSKIIQTGSGAHQASVRDLCLFIRGTGLLNLCWIEYLGLHNMPKAAVHLGQKLTSPNEEVEEKEDRQTKPLYCKRRHFTLSLNLLRPIVRHIVNRICKRKWNFTERGLSHIALFYSVQDALHHVTYDGRNRTSEGIHPASSVAERPSCL